MSKTKKYSLYPTIKAIEIDGKEILLYRIVANKDLRDGTVKAGDMGGWVQSEKNLSQSGDSWIFDDAIVCGTGCLNGDTAVSGNIVMYNGVIGDAKRAKPIKDKKYIVTEQRAIVTKGDEISFDVYRIQAIKDLRNGLIRAGDLGGFVQSEKNLSQEGDAWIYGNAVICGDMRVEDDVTIYGNFLLGLDEKGTISGNLAISDKDHVNSMNNVIKKWKKT